jgi:hypothetical protein
LSAVKLVERYPSVPQISIPPDASLAVEEALLGEYLDWRLAQLDTVSIDVLLQSPDGKRLVLLLGPTVTAWFRVREGR